MGISISEAQKLIPASRKEVMREFDRKGDFAKSHLEKNSDHENIPDTFNVVSKGFEKLSTKFE